MVPKSFVALCMCRWREFRREPSAFFWVVFLPIMVMIFLGVGFGGKVKERYVVGVDRDSCAAKIAQGDFFAASLTDGIDFLPLGMNDIDRLSKRGSVCLGIKCEAATLIYLYDAANRESLMARRVVDDLLQQRAGRQDSIDARSESLNLPGGRYVDFLVPGLLAMSIMTSSLFGVGMTIVANRRENLLKRYMATPMSGMEFILSHVIGRMMVLTWEFVGIILAAFLIFRFQILGNFALFFIIAALGAGAFTSIALLFASRTKSIPAVAGMINLLTLPLMILSGVFFRTMYFPEYAQPFLKILPLTALVDGLRIVSLEGGGILDVKFELMVLSGYLVVFAVLAKIRFRWV